MWVVGKGEHFDHWVKDHHNPKNQGQPTHKQKCKLLSNAKKKEKQNLRVHFLDLNLYQPVSLMLRSFILFIYSFFLNGVWIKTTTLSANKKIRIQKRETKSLETAAIITELPVTSKFHCFYFCWELNLNDSLLLQVIPDHHWRTKKPSHI